MQYLWPFQVVHSMMHNLVISISRLPQECLKVMNHVIFSHTDKIKNQSLAHLSGIKLSEGTFFPDSYIHLQAILYYTTCSITVRSTGVNPFDKEEFVTWEFLNWNGFFYLIHFLFFFSVFIPRNLYESLSFGCVPIMIQWFHLEAFGQNLKATAQRPLEQNICTQLLSIMGLLELRINNSNINYNPLLTLGLLTTGEGQRQMPKCPPTTGPIDCTCSKASKAFTHLRSMWFPQAWQALGFRKWCIFYM
jgi:hypothetical protein